MIEFNLTAARVSSVFHAHCNPGRPRELDDVDPLSALEGREQRRNVWLVVRGPIRLRKHVVDDVQSSRLEKRQGVLQVCVLAWPGIGVDQIDNACDRARMRSYSAGRRVGISFSINAVPYATVRLKADTTFAPQS